MWVNRSADFDRIFGSSGAAVCLSTFLALFLYISFPQYCHVQYFFIFAIVVDNLIVQIHLLYISAK